MSKEATFWTISISVYFAVCCAIATCKIIKARLRRRLLFTEADADISTDWIPSMGNWHTMITTNHRTGKVSIVTRSESVIEYEKASDQLLAEAYRILNNAPKKEL